MVKKPKKGKNRIKFTRNKITILADFAPLPATAWGFGVKTIKNLKILKMKIAELEYGQIIAFESKNQYCFETDNELFTYENYIPLDCSFDEAFKNFEHLTNAYPLIQKHTLCAGKTLREF